MSTKDKSKPRCSMVSSAGVRCPNEHNHSFVNPFNEAKPLYLCTPCYQVIMDGGYGEDLKTSVTQYQRCRGTE